MKDFTKEIDEIIQNWLKSENENTTYCASLINDLIKSKPKPVDGKTRLSLKLIESYGFKQRIFKPDWDDTSVEYTLPNGIYLTGSTQINNKPCKTDCLEGYDGKIYIETKQKLDELLKMSCEEVEEKYNLID